MTDLQRLKFAFARGARIQHDNCQEVVEEWRYTSAPLWGTICNYRVHPDDAHLEYGPLSTAMRNSVLYEAWPLDSIYRAAEKLFHDAYDFPPGPTQQYDWGMQKLMFAEYLADEGL
jgi:hypothetical protein